MADYSADQIDLNQILAAPLSQDSQGLRRILLDHLAEARPAWLWDARSGDLIWQNDAAKIFGGSDESSVAPDAMKGQLRRILDITPLGQETLSRLHFSTETTSFDRICRCTPIELSVDESGTPRTGIMSVSVDPVSGFEKVKSGSILTSAQMLGFAGALVQKGGVVLKQSKDFTALIGDEFDSELIVGLSSAARHSTTIAVESDHGRREFQIVRVAGKDKIYLALIDLYALELPDSEAENVEQNNQPASSDPSEPGPSAGPLSVLIDQLSELGLVRADVPQDKRESAGDVTQNNDAPASRDAPVEDTVTEGSEPLPNADDLAESERYNFNEVSRILHHRLAGDASSRSPQPSVFDKAKSDLDDIAPFKSSKTLAKSLEKLLAKAPAKSSEKAPAKPTVTPPGTPGDNASTPQEKLSHDHLILNRLPLGILIYRDQETLFTNRAMVKLLGYESNEDLRRRGVAAVIPETDQDEDFGPLSQLLNRHGEKMDVTVRLQTITWLDQPCFMITAQVLSAAAVLEDDDSVSAAFFENVVRQLRGPLNTISGFGEMLAMQEFGPLGHLRYTEYAGDIVTAANQAAVIIDEASELSQLGSDSIALDRDAIDLTALLERAVSRVRKQANDGQVLIRENIAENMSDIIGDAPSVAKIVLNLLANAIHVTPSGGQVILTASRVSDDRDHIDIHIRHRGGPDTQISLREDFILFHPRGFEQSERDIAASTSGFGLGIVEAMAEANDISVKLHTLSDRDSLMEIFVPLTPRI